MSIECDFDFQRGDFTLRFCHVLSGRGITAISGRSGSGKTTLLRLMAGLEKADKATFIVNQKVFQQENLFVPVEDRDIGYVGQKTRLFPFLNAGNNIRFAEKRANKPTYPPPDSSALITIFAVEDCLNKKPAQLSSGEIQRISIICSLVSQPRLFLFDEAFSGIDKTRRRVILRYLEDYLAQRQLPAIYVSHDDREIDEMETDNIIVIG